MTYWACTAMALAALLVALLAARAQDEPVLGFGAFTNPTVTVSYDPPPTVGVRFQELTFADAATTCAQMIGDGATQRLLAEGTEVTDRQDLRNILVERQLQATGLEGIQVATALVAVNASRCSSDRDLARNKSRAKYLARTSYFIQGSIRLIDVSSGKVMLTHPISVSVKETEESSDGSPSTPGSRKWRRRL